MKTTWMLSVVAATGILVTVGVTGCGQQKAGVISNVDGTSTPVMPMPTPGNATVSGRVLNAEGQPVAGAVVHVAETDGVATSDATGAYQLMVLADSTITLVTTADGFAKSYRESAVFADQAMVPGFDVLLLPSGMMTSFAAMAVDQGVSRGVMALRLHSLNEACLTAGARVSVWPPKAATVFYSQPSTTGGLDQPDTALDAVQGGTNIHAWLVGAVSPGGQLFITVEQTGCRVVSPSPSVGGVQFPGLRTIGAQALTEGDVFLE